MKIAKLSSIILLLSVFLYSCQKEYSFENAKTPVGTWQFNDSTVLYTGNMDSAYIETTATTKTLHLRGTSTDGAQTFNLNLYATDSFTVGTYKASLFQSDFEYFNSAKTLYQGDQFIGEFIVVITAIGNNQVTGTFSGLAQDSSGNIKTITLGQFTSAINLSGNGTGGGGTGAATGTLGSSSGTCTPATFSGTFTQGVALSSANTVQLTVTVATAGTYTISTNTVNGVTFLAAGTFTGTGVQNVILTATGTPTNSGAQTFTVTFGSSTCSFVLTFGAGAAAATGTLGATAGACTPANVSGTYTQGTVLTPANTVQLTVNVATTGTYTISTNTVNGVTFSATGTFTTTGVQNVTLTGTGTSTASGSQTFTVTFGSSTCTFSITFAAGTVLDYLPTTLNSNWTYWTVNFAASPDSLFDKVIAYNPSFSGQTYASISETLFPKTNPPNDTLYFRKPGGDYYQYIPSVDDFFGFDPGTGSPSTAEYIILKDNVAQGTTWNSLNFVGKASGVSYTLSIKMTLKAKAVTATVGSLNFSDVIKVTYEFFVNGSTSGYIQEQWFQRGVGLINFFDNNSPPTTQMIGPGWQVF